MLGRRRDKFERTQLGTLPPVQLHNRCLGNTPLAQVLTNAQRDQESPDLGRELFNRPLVQMVVMIMADHDGGDIRELSDIQWYRMKPLGSHPLDR